MRRTITLRYPATCRECGAELAAGERARYYGPYRVYGIGCHARSEPATRPKQETWDRARQERAAMQVEPEQHGADSVYITAQEDAYDDAWLEKIR